MKAPKPFSKDSSKIEAFVLGCDSTAYDEDGNRLEFEFVFDMGNDERYFAGVLANLTCLIQKDKYQSFNFRRAL